MFYVYLTDKYLLIKIKTMETLFIECSCGNTTGFKHSHNVAECTSCAAVIHMDTPVYHQVQYKSLDEIAKEQALIDMRELDYIDWSQVFDTDNISEANKCITCYEQGFTSYLDNKDSCQIDTCPENRVAI
tara:strand:+ start:345 stop:734 length:390 start_codon:yes stop_codon:yes gene_type:complete